MNLIELETPMYGWSQLTICGWSDRVSYLDDVPYELLKAFISILTRRSPASVKFDAEGYEYIIVFDLLETHVIFEYDMSKSCNIGDNTDFYLITIHVNIKEIAEKIADDIEKNIVEWSEWASDDLTAEEIAERAEALTKYCKIVKNLLNKKY